MIEDYQAYIEGHGHPQRFELLLADINGIWRGKWVPNKDQQASWEGLCKGKARLPLSTYAPNILGEEVEASGLGIVVGDPDGILQPIPGTLKPVPWAEVPTAQVQVQMLGPEGSVDANCPRAILARTLDRFKAHGWTPVMAAELEFYLFPKRAKASEAPRPPEFSPKAQNFSTETLAQFQPILDEIEATAQMQGLDSDTIIAEFGPGQFEVNFNHTAHGLKAADTCLLFRRLVRAIANKHGYEASFMAKPYAEYSGSGMHLHCSVLDATGANIFDDGASSTTPNERLKQAIAGQLGTMAQAQAVFAPHLNSYRRFRANSFAPTSPSWGLNNRTAGVRIPETAGPGARFEHRIAGADVNPYLAFAAILGGALAGLEQPDLHALPPQITDGAASEALSKDWQTALDLFAGSGWAAHVFGAGYRDIFAAVKQDELNQLTAPITPLEYDAYLSRF